MYSIQTSNIVDPLVDYILMLLYFDVIIYSRSGTAITLMTRNDWRNAKALIEIMEEASQVYDNYITERSVR